MDKVLIYLDNGAKQRFLKEAETVKDQADTLIGYFETFQDLRQITTLAEFERLVSDPLEYFDETLRDNVEMRMRGREPEPSTLAKLFGYERDNYIAVISGLPVTENCGPCKSSRIVRRAGKPAITSARWEAYKDYLTFTPDGFILNDEAIELYCQKFNYYATEPKQMEVVELFNQLVDALNRFDAMSPLPQKDKEALTRMFKIGIERPPHDGRFLIDQLSLRDEVFKY